MPKEAISTKRIKAVVVIPPVRDFYFTRHRFSSLGAHIVNEILIQQRIASTLLNFPLMNKNGQQTEFPGDISYLKEFVLPNETGKLSYFTNYQLFGPSIEVCAQKIVSGDPAICFLSCFAFSYAGEVLDLCRVIKKENLRITIIVGGAGASAYPLYFLRDTSIDFVVSGEAEVSLKKFLMAFLFNELPLDKVPNLSWKKDKELHLSTHLDVAPGTEIMPTATLVHATNKSVYISTSLSRGCPYLCEFCSNHLTHGRNFRTAPLESLFSAISSLAIDQNDQNRQIFVNFEDDNLLLAPSILVEAMTGIRKRIPKALFLFENGIDFRLLSTDLVDQLISLGMASFNFTLGSKNGAILDASTRKSSLTQFESIVSHISLKGIPVLSYFIAGLREDSPQSVVETLAYLSGIPTAVGLSMFYAVPGLPGFTNRERFDKIESCLCNGSSAFPWNNSLSTKQLVTAFRLSRYVNLVKSGKKSAEDVAVIDKIQSSRKLFTYIRKNKTNSIVEVPNYDEEMVGMFFDAERKSAHH